MNPMTSLVKPLVHRVYGLPGVNRRAFLAAYGPHFRAWCRANVCEELPERDELYRFLVTRHGLDSAPIDYLEFGVFRGETIRWWSENNRNPDSTFVGFDSFKGLPEQWRSLPKGTFSTDGRIPQIPDPRCTFVEGLFHDSLPDWLVGRNFPYRTVVHLDADLYSSTLLVLTQLLPKLKHDDILIFDEFAEYLDEYRALTDALAAYRREVAPLCRTREWRQVALRMT